MKAVQALKALVVDDSKVGRLTMRKKLAAFGVGVDLAESGLEALSYLERHRPDVIFMDHMMPDLDGFEATRRIKATPATRNIPVIIISGSDDEAFVRDARAIGAFDAIAKPPANDVIERILVALPQVEAGKVAAEATLPAAAPAQERVATMQAELASIKAMIDTAIDEAIRQLRGEWQAALLRQMEAVIENERHLQRAWSGRVEQRLDDHAAATEGLRQQLHGLETRLETLEAATLNLTTPNEAWLESAADRVRPRLAELSEAVERQAATLDGLRQELLHGMEDRLAREAAVTRELAARIAAVSEAMQQGETAAQEAYRQRLDALEQRLLPLEAAASRLEADQASLRPSLETSLRTALSGQLADLLRERDASQAAELDRLREQLQAVGQSPQALQSALSAQGEGLGTLLEARFAQVRAELDATLHAAVAGRAATPETLSATSGVESAAAAPEPATAAPAADDLPAAAVDQDTEARLAQRPADAGDARWQQEVERLQGMVKKLALATAAGGVALLAAIIILAS